MTTYKIIITAIGKMICRINPSGWIPLDPANTDYQQFKLDIANGAELQDADGNVMSELQAQQFLETLP